MTRWKLNVAIMLALGTLASSAFTQTNRDRLLIVGSSTVYPFAEKVGQQFSENTGMKAPEIRSTGTGDGMKLFCAGAGQETPDIVNASRPIKPAEVELCAKNGVNEIIEVTVGYDAIVVVSLGNAQPLNLTRKELFLALAKNVPDPKDETQLIPNPYQNWKDINPDLPNQKIKVWGPDQAHGTYDLILSNIMLAGCRQLNSIKAMEQANPEKFTAVCQTFRQDGAYTEDGKFEKILAAVKSDPNTVGILSFSYLVQDTTLRGAEIDSMLPAYGSIAHGVYPLTRPLRFYLKKAHIDVVSGLREFVSEFTSEPAWGTTQGYLVKLGMVPMPLSERRQVKSDVEKLKPLSR